jgi:hypothetical protein
MEICMTDLVLSHDSEVKDSKQSEERPWEDCVIIAHFGIETYAAAAGFDSVDKFLKHLIREAATRTI